MFIKTYVWKHLNKTQKCLNQPLYLAGATIPHLVKVKLKTQFYLIIYYFFQFYLNWAFCFALLQCLGKQIYVVSQVYRPENCPPEIFE